MKIKFIRKGLLGALTLYLIFIYTGTLLEDTQSKIKKSIILPSSKEVFINRRYVNKTKIINNMKAEVEIEWEDNVSKLRITNRAHDTLEKILKDYKNLERAAVYIKKEESIKGYIEVRRKDLLLYQQGKSDSRGIEIWFVK